LGPDLTDESTEGDGTLTRYESLHMGHFEKMMSKNHAKDSDGKCVNYKVIVKIVKYIFPFIKK
jgi:hypothetical protein